MGGGGVGEEIHTYTRPRLQVESQFSRGLMQGAQKEVGREGKGGGSVRNEPLVIQCGMNERSQRPRRRRPSEKSSIRQGQYRDS